MYAPVGPPVAPVGADAHIGPPVARAICPQIPTVGAELGESRMYAHIGPPAAAHIVRHTPRRPARGLR